MTICSDGAQHDVKARCRLYERHKHCETQINGRRCDRFLVPKAAGDVAAHGMIVLVLSIMCELL